MDDRGRRRFLIGLGVGTGITTLSGCSTNTETNAEESNESASNDNQSSPLVINQETDEEYSSIQTAIDNASAGDRILLQSGVHVERQVILVNKPISIKGEDGAYVAWDGGSENKAGVPHSNEVVPPTIFLVRAHHVSFENIVIDGLSHHKSEPEYSENVNNTRYGIAVYEGTKTHKNLVIRNVEIRNTILEGIHLFRVDGVVLDAVRSSIQTSRTSNIKRTSNQPLEPAPPLPSYPSAPQTQNSTSTSTDNISPKFRVQ